MATTRFAVDVRKWADVTGLSLENVVRAATIEVFARVIRKSPVDTGRFKGNWQLNERGFVETRFDKSGEITIATVTRGVEQSEVGGVTSFINNLPYGERLEFGYSKQAPEGMVRLTALEFSSAVEEAAARERR